MIIKGHTDNDLVGILKLLSDLFMMFPCCTENVINWSRQQFIIIVLAKMGGGPGMTLFP